MKEKNINGYTFQLYRRDVYDTPQVIKRSADFLRFMDKRRSVTEFSNRPVPREIIENLILTASSSPSGANLQPWTFCAVNDPKLKHIIREAAEKEEQENYAGRLPEDWKKVLKPLQTDGNKGFIDEAPWLIVVFKHVVEAGVSTELYHLEESVGIATGILFAAIHNAGMAAQAHSPNPMSFLKEKLGRPANEEPFLMIALGYPADECYVPKIIRKGLKDVAVFYEE